MKHPAFLLFTILLSGCTTVVKYEPMAEPGPAKPPDYPIYIYAQKMEVPRHFETIGAVRIRDTPFTIFGGSLEGELDRLQEDARNVGADAVQLTSVQQPDFLHAKYRVDANLIRFTNVWEYVELTEEDLLAYFRFHEKTLDPVEGIWLGNDEMQSRIGIVKNKDRQGRDYIAFILNSMNPSWQLGDKKMDLAKGEWPWVYRGTYYLDDYRPDGIVFTLQNPRINAFIVYLAEEPPVIFHKEAPVN